MKIKKGFVLQKVCEENIIISHGIENISFSNIIQLNESAAMIWEHVIDKDFSIEDITSLLLDNYEVDESTAQADAIELMENWEAAGVLCS